MKTVECGCGKKIQVRGGIAGLTMRFPQEVYICACGVAYLPEHIGCMIYDSQYQEDSANPRVLSPVEYALFKAKETRHAERICGFKPENVFIEMVAAEQPKEEKQ